MNTRTNKAKTRLKQVYSGLLIVVVSILFSNTSYAQSNECKAELKIENDISSKNASVRGSSFRMSLTGLSDKATVYKISVKDLKKKNSIRYRVKIFVLNKKDNIKENYHKSSDSEIEITLNRGETLQFIVELLAPKDVNIGDTINSEVIVTSDECSDFFLSKELQINISKGSANQY
jgi:hypothetical protein